MKITDIRVRCVAIPLNAQLRHNTGVHPGYFLRTILEVFTDEGIVGLGEVGGGDQRAALMKLKPRIVGVDPFHLEIVKMKVLRSIYYLSNARSEEHTSELQSLMRISYAVFCLKKKNKDRCTYTYSSNRMDNQHISSKSLTST